MITETTLAGAAELLRLAEQTKKGYPHHGAQNFTRTGFLVFNTSSRIFEEKQRPNHIIRDMVDFYKVPVYELNRIKNGADFVTPEGEVIPNLCLTRPSAPARKYALLQNSPHS